MSVVPRFICPAVCIARNGITRSPLSQNRFGPEVGWECGQGGRVGDYRCGCWSFDGFIWFPFSWPFFVPTLGIAIVEKTVKKTSFCKQLRRVVPYPELMMSVHFLWHLQVHCKPASHAFRLPWCLGTFMTFVFWQDCKSYKLANLFPKVFYNHSSPWEDLSSLFLYHVPSLSVYGQHTLAWFHYPKIRENKGYFLEDFLSSQQNWVEYRKFPYTSCLWADIFDFIVILIFR